MMAMLIDQTLIRLNARFELFEIALADSDQF